MRSIFFVNFSSRINERYRVVPVDFQNSSLINWHACFAGTIIYESRLLCSKLLPPQKSAAAECRCMEYNISYIYIQQ